MNTKQIKFMGFAYRDPHLLNLIFFQKASSTTLLVNRKDVVQT